MKKYFMTLIAVMTAIVFGTQPFLGVIAAVTGPQTPPQVIEVTADKTYDQTSFYQADSPLGVFQNSHLVGFHQIATHEQVNGNIMTDLLDYHAPIEAQVSYIRQLQAETDVILTADTPEALAVLGGNISLQNREQGLGITMTNGQTVNLLQPDYQLNPDQIWQDGAIEFLDFAELKALAVGFNQQVSQYAQTKGTTMTTEGEQLTITFDPEIEVQVENLTAEMLAPVKTIVVKGMPKTTEQTYFVNIDLQGQKTLALPQVVIEYPNGEQVSIDTTADLSNNLIWNFYDSKVENKQYNGTITINNELIGNLLAPQATFDVQASLNGFIIAEAIQVFAPTFAAPFMGKNVNRAVEEPETAPEAETEPEVEIESEQAPEVNTEQAPEVVAPLSETYSIDGLTVTKSIDKTNLTVGEEATVTLKVSGTQTATPAPITTEEDIMIVLDTSASMKSYWNDTKYKQVVIDFIKSVVDKTENNGKVRVRGIIFNGPGYNVTGVDNNQRPLDTKLLFNTGTAIASIETAINGIIAGQHVNNSSYTNSTNDAGTNFQDLFGEGIATSPLANFIITDPDAIRKENKHVIIISDWVATAQKQTNGAQSDTTIVEAAQTAGYNAYNNKIKGELGNKAHKEKVKIYPIQFGNTTAGGDKDFITTLRSLTYANSTGQQITPIQTKEQLTTPTVAGLSAALSNIRGKIAGTTTTTTPKLTITDYLDLTKFDYVANSAAIAGATGTGGHSADTSTQTIKYSDITKGTSDVVVTYKIKAKASTSGTNIPLSPTTPVGAVVAGTQTQNIPVVTVNVSAAAIIDNTGLKAEANPTTIKQGEQTKIKLIVEGNEHENTDTSFFTYQGFESFEYPASANYSDGTSRDNNYHFGTAKGSTITFTFTGKGFEWYVGNKHLDSITTYNMGNVSVRITDVNQNVISTETTTWGESNSNEDVSQQVYRKRDLAYGTYQVTITLNEAGFVYSDRIQVINPYGGTTDADTVLTAQWSANTSITINGSSGFQWYGKTTGEVAGTLTIKEGITTIRTISFKKNDSTEGLLLSESRLDPTKTYTATYTVTSGVLTSGKVIKLPTEKQSNINITDYIDTAKFEFVPGTYTAKTGTTVVGSVEIGTANQTVITLENIKVGKTDIIVEYDIKAKNNAPEGMTITNPETQPGLVTATTTQAKAKFMDTEVMITTVLPTGNLALKKTATDNGDDTYSIMLEAKGTPQQTAAKTADIVVVIDKSGSMQDKITQVKTAVNNFNRNILAGTMNDQVRIAIAAFDYSANASSTPGASSYIKTAFTANLTTLNNAVNTIAAGGGTNTEDGIWRAQNLLQGARSDAKQYVVFFTDGLPTQSHSGGNGTTSDDRYFADAQEQYYRNFKGFNSPTSVQIGGIGTNQTTTQTCSLTTINGQPATSTTKCTLNLTQTPYSTPTHANAKFYSVGLFTNATFTQKQQAINFLKTIQNVIHPNDFGNKYYTQNLSDINSIFTDISTDIKADINNVIAKDAIIQDIVTKEFSIVANSWTVTDLQGRALTISPENIIITKTANGEDDITFKVGQIVSDGTTANGGGGVRITFKIKAKDDYFSGTAIPTNVNADINYTDPEDGIVYEQFFPVPTVDIAAQSASLQVRKSVVQNVNGVLVPATGDTTPFTIVVERVPSVNDPSGLINYQKTHTLTSGNVATTGTKQLIGPNTVAKDGSLILSTDAVNQSQYLVAGEYIVKEINLPTTYTLQEIKINGTTFKRSISENLVAFMTRSQNQATFTLSKEKAVIEIEVVNKSILTNNLIKDKTATPVLDANGKATDDYEIALNVKLPSEQYLGGDWKSNVSIAGAENGNPTAGTTYPTRINQSYDGQTLKLKTSGTETKEYARGLGVHANSAIIYDLTKAPYAGYDQFQAVVGIQAGTNTAADVKFEVYVDGVQQYTSDLMETNDPAKIFNITITGAKELKLVVNKNVNDYYDHANWADAKLTRNAITNATITDIVTDDFNIVTDGYGSGKTSLVLDANGNEVANVTKTINGQTLTWSPLTITGNGLTIKFKVRPKDTYHAQDDVDTNVEATVKYNGYTEYFNKPSVDLGVRGRIAITKNILNANNPDDVFKIKLSGGDSNETYEFNLKNKETKNLEVILIQNADTIVEKPGQKMTIGTYIVEEIAMPADYACVKIQIGNQSYLLGTGATFTIDKTTPEINIVVENKVIPHLEKTAIEVGDRIYEINLTVDSNGLKASNVNEVLTIEDIITPEFEILQQSYYKTDGSLNYNDSGNLEVAASGKVSVVKNLQETLINTDHVITTVNSLQQISWTINMSDIITAGITDTGVSIKFLVKVKDEYYGGKDRPTNKEAHLKYAYSDGLGGTISEDLLFPVPDVDIPYVLGSITVTKEIIDANGSITTANPTDRFAISLEGKERYTFDLANGQTESMSFYLKGAETDISPNTDLGLNYVTAGTYTVEELIPMNYEQVQIWIDTNPGGTTDEWQKLEEYLADTENETAGTVKDGKLVIGNENRSLNIKVTNQKVNEAYWFDRTEVINQLDYLKPASRSGIFQRLQQAIQAIFN